MCIDSKGEPENEAERNEKMFGLDKWRLWRHSPMNVQFNGGDVEVIPYEDSDLYFQIFGPLSRVIENQPAVKYLPLAIPVIGPTIFVVERLNHYISIVRLTATTIQKVVEEFMGRFSEEVKRFASTLRKKYMESKVTGAYRTDTAVLRSTADELDRLSGQMKQVQEEIRQIAANLPYDSVSGNYYRVKLYAIAGSVGSDAGKAGKCASAGRTAADQFENAERVVADRFAN